MMKIKSILAVAATGLLLAACQGEQGKSLDQLKDATPGDSLVYYFGQINGAQYLTGAERDSTMATDAAKQAYIKGVKDGLNNFRPGEESYNRGMMLGLQMARNIDSFKEDYDVQLNKQVFIEGLVEALMSDSVTNTNDIQREFNRIMNDFSTAKEKKDQAAAAENLSKEAAKLKLAEINPDLYGGATDKKDGQQIKSGDNVTANITFKKANGEKIDIPFPSAVQVGSNNLPSPINDALCALKSGESGKFATSAQALFGRRSEQFSLSSNDVVIMEIKASIDPEQPAQ
ncbi:MAG: hypothetical protein K2M10_09260 [Muribaculaceae bacterium]|nr:hypothetical protein [Muribaculaceae bacterium]MDE6299813.1 hypothetical protein [Muribaculaceae bacterium]